MAYMQFKQFKSYLAPQPIVTHITPKSVLAESLASAKISLFFSGDLGDTLKLEGEDLTQLARTSKLLEAQNRQYEFTLKDSLMVVRNSLPVSQIPGIFMKALRYFHPEGFVNSELQARPDLQKELFEWAPVKATMNGVAATLTVFPDHGRINVRNWVQDTAFYDSAFKSLKSVRILHDTLYLVR